MSCLICGIDQVWLEIVKNCHKEVQECKRMQARCFFWVQRSNQFDYSRERESLIVPTSYELTNCSNFAQILTKYHLRSSPPPKIFMQKPIESRLVTLTSHQLNHTDNSETFIAIVFSGAELKFLLHLNNEQVVDLLKLTCGTFKKLVQSLKFPVRLHAKFCFGGF